MVVKGKVNRSATPADLRVDGPASQIMKYWDVDSFT
jgi:hypothetical protein